MSRLGATFPKLTRLKRIAWLADEIWAGSTPGEVLRMDDLPYAITMPVEDTRAALELLRQQSAVEKRSEMEYVRVARPSGSVAGISEVKD